MTVLRIPNRTARQLWLQVNGLGDTPTGPLDLKALIHNLGFVQLDTIQVVSRAHHHILWSRNQNYREPMLNRHLALDRGVFEHFTHDASVLPMAFLPMWQRQFRRMRDKVSRSSWFGKHLADDHLDHIRRRIRDEGPLSTHDFDTKIQGAREMWKRPPHKIGLDYLWYAGELATCHRDGFTKYYDLAERVFPKELRSQDVPDQKQIDWLCQAALDRIGVGKQGEIRKFWDATEVSEVAEWAERSASSLVPAQIESAEGGWTTALATSDIEERLARLTPPTSRLRILNPFDPAIRDRVRLKRLFGFDYTVEMFVPAAKRVWGYYVYPLLEGDRFVGRIEAKADRKQDRLTVQNLWWEPGVRVTPQRQAKLESELVRLARLADVSEIVWQAATP
ncbi:MAG: winged helix DNA-binding domain-containing protein [Marivita sp.]|uniref:winged helix-turn-helix domain-containing protein n=1 Tax=Marivita sp. TaxID=2003365 RepID=UPI0025C174AA|nr:crosslink repair DNA glycosylase YcaQ family protein [Marivita sp.]MCI5112789.1 winged helix DNA-binding domain-containing protein [Marivita sp.]